MEESWGDVAPGVDWNGGLPAIRVTKLFMGTSLADLNKAEGFQSLDHLPRFEDGEGSHV